MNMMTLALVLLLGLTSGCFAQPQQGRLPITGIVDSRSFYNPYLLELYYNQLNQMRLMKPLVFIYS